MLADRASELAARRPPRRVFILASGPTLSIARYGAAKLLEYAVDAGAQCLEEFHHLEMFIGDQDSWLVPVLPDAASADRFAEVRGVHADLGMHTLECSADGDLAVLPALARPQAQVLAAQALQWLAYGVARGLGRQVNQWVGGVRRDAIYRMSNRTVRSSSVEPTDYRRTV